MSECKMATIPQQMHAEAALGGLGADVIIARNDPFFSVPSEAREYLRARMSPAEMEAEIQALGDLAAARWEHGDFCLLGLNPLSSAYGSIDSGITLEAWLHDHERKRMNALKCALPTAPELAAAARERIKARIAARKGRARKGQLSLGSGRSETVRSEAI